MTFKPERRIADRVEFAGINDFERRYHSVVATGNRDKSVNARSF